MDERPVAERDPRLSGRAVWHGAVLLSDEIEFYSRELEPRLIDPFDATHLRAARYNLTLGSRARVGGDDRAVDERHPLVIPAHQVAVVSTREVISLPRFLIARWNLAVPEVYEGLLWVGALQVDPGWRGELFAPIYNLSNRDVVLYHGQEMFAMDFVRTTGFDPKRSKPYEPHRSTLEEHDVHRLRSQVYDELRQFRELKQTVDAVLAREGTFIAVVVGVLGAIITALSIIVASPFIDPGEGFLDAWPVAALIASFSSFIIALVALGVLGIGILSARGRIVLRTGRFGILFFLGARVRPRQRPRRLDPNDGR